jgi:hypothetical protein
MAGYHRVGVSPAIRKYRVEMSGLPTIRQELGECVGKDRKAHESVRAIIGQRVGRTAWTLIDALEVFRFPRPTEAGAFDAIVESLTISLSALVLQPPDQW